MVNWAYFSESLEIYNRQYQLNPEERYLSKLFYPFT